ncbi:hypothetical protein FOA52_006310 [Chlamydomonas sp. UWO 241]|nr:hypothetical protein FOA52_006310 [Chlamydomonas sp. UWO 241]
MSSPGGSGGGSGTKLFGCVVMTLSGEPLWQGWLFKPSAKLATKPLCAAVALVLGKRGGQDSSFITTGPYAVSSVRDGDYIVSIVCASTCPEPEMLMKSKELAHNVKILLGTEQVAKLSRQSPEDLAKMMASTNMLQLFKLCYEAEADSLDGATARAYDADVGAWIDSHGTNEALQNFFISKLRLLSPAEDGFRVMAGVDGFVCAQLVDLADPGDVLLAHWPDAAAARASTTADPTTIAGMLGKHDSTLWQLVIRETRNMVMQAGPPRARGRGGVGVEHCTIDLSAFGRGLQATAKRVAMEDYDPAFVVVYQAPHGQDGSGVFRVSHEDGAVPEQVRIALHTAEQLLLAKFPSTRQNLLEAIWPGLAPGGTAATAAASTSGPYPLPATLPGSAVNVAGGGFLSRRASAVRNLGGSNPDAMLGDGPSRSETRDALRAIGTLTVPSSGGDDTSPPGTPTLSGTHSQQQQHQQQRHWSAPATATVAAAGGGSGPRQPQQAQQAGMQQAAGAMQQPRPPPHDPSRRLSFPTHPQLPQHQQHPYRPSPAACGRLSLGPPVTVPLATADPLIEAFMRQGSEGQSDGGGGNASAVSPTSEMERLALRSQVGRWDLQLSQERAMRSWLAPDFARQAPGGNPFSLPSRATDAEIDAVVAGTEAGGRGPSAVWRLLNGEWQQLTSGGVWARAPAAGGPMASHAPPPPPPLLARAWDGTRGRGSSVSVAAVTASPGGRRGRAGRRSHAGDGGGAAADPYSDGAGGARACAYDDRSDQDYQRRGRHRSSSASGGDADRGVDFAAGGKGRTASRGRTAAAAAYAQGYQQGSRDYLRRDVDPELDADRIRTATITATATAAAVAAASAPVAAGIALQVWHSLQSGAFIGIGMMGTLHPGSSSIGAIPLPPLPAASNAGGAPFGTDAAAVSRLAVAQTVAADAASRALGGGAAASMPRYYSGARGETYCCVDGAWFLLPQATALSAPHATAHGGGVDAPVHEKARAATVVEA